ncbi:AAA family ATPase [Fusibacter paucivorans]|uniref:AAA family ATPase n=1 Tax=Fusibacter paucivorans TaxID=76009 RepID=A0ABS5PNR6_9FIRM|nr:AAA family ATPase [Fusibacter paucivorans]MBS7525692.1 AAA family ATPase [Fusibacter paucivorans]
MKINAIHYRTYGKLNDYTLTLDEGINTIYGGNESGKSTIFNSIRSLLYGFSPASRERHPYVNWTRGEIDFEGRLTVDGMPIRVIRQLKSSPKLMILDEVNGTTESKRNDALPWVSDITDSLYESIYHLTAEMLIDLEASSWERIQERLIFNYGMDYLNKSSDVIQAMVQDLNGIWRPDRRGTPRLAQIERRLRELTRSRIEGEQQYDNLKGLIENAEALMHQIQRIDQQRKWCIATAQELNKLLPVKQKHEKIEMLKREQQHLALYEKIPEDSLVKYHQLIERMQEMTAEREALRGEYETLEREKKVFNAEEKLILTNAAELEKASEALRHYELADQQLHELSAALSMKTEQLERELNHLFEAPYQAAYDAVKSINPVALKTALYRYFDLKQKGEKARVEAWSLALGKKRRYGILMAASLMGIASGWLLPDFRPLAWLSVALFGIALGGLLQRQIKSEAKDDDLETVAANIEAMFTPLNLPAYLWTDTSLIFAGRIEQTAGLIFEADKLSARIEAEKEKCEALEAVMRHALADINASDTPVLLTLQLTLQKLKALSRVQIENERLQDKIMTLKARCNEFDIKMAALNENLSEIELKFLNLGMGNLDEGIAIFERDQGIGKRISIFEEELLSDIALYDALKHYENPELINERYIEELEELREELEETRQKAVSEKSSCEAEIESIKAAVRLDELDSEYQMLMAEREALVARRDQLMVMMEVLQYADDKFRRENQPDILNRVSELMAEMTLGKYQKVLISESFELQFLVGDEVLPISKAFSKGTLNQLFLAFRLAVIEMINRDKPPLPIVLDEAFVNWDDQRLTATYKVLEDFAKRHQILIMTCHEPKRTYHLVQLPETQSAEAVH